MLKHIITSCRADNVSRKIRILCLDSGVWERFRDWYYWGVVQWYEQRTKTARQ